METSTPYQVKTKLDKHSRRRVLQEPYTQAVKDILCSLTLGYESYATDEELCDRAMAIADTLIEKVGERL